MHRVCIVVAIHVALLLQTSVKSEEPAPSSEFLVRDATGQIAILGADGEELERIEWSSSIADFSPNGEWLAYLESIPKENRGKLVIRSRGTPEQRMEIPLVWGRSGTSCRPCWAPDSKSLLVVEADWKTERGISMVCRVYDLDRHSIIDLDLPERYWPSDWSAGERRLLVAVRDAGQPIRLGWVNIDGSGDPEFITSADEFPSLGRLSPEGGRILCRIGPVSPPGVSPETRLHVVDLATGNRTLLDEPGLSCGYCWSVDGSRIAYTWQPTLPHPERVSERQALLVTCDADGSNRKVVTSRKYTMPTKVSGRSNYPIFFTVLDWR